MYKEILDFLASIREQEKYLLDTNKLLKKKSKEYYDENFVEINLSMLLFYLNQKSKITDNKEIKELDKNILKIIGELEKKGISVEISENGNGIIHNYKGSKFHAMKTIEKYIEIISSRKVLYISSFINIVSILERFFAAILQYLLFYDSKNFDKADKKFTLPEIESFSDINEVKSAIIEEHIQQITRTNFLEWVEYLQKNKVISTMDKKLKNSIYEVFLRRNIFVHNGGIINSVYISKAAKGIHKFNKGDNATIELDYILSSLNLLKNTFIEIAIDAWFKVRKNDKSRGEEIVNITYRLLSDKDYACAKTISEKYLSASKKTEVSEEDLKIIEINRLIAMKQLKVDWILEKEKLENTSYSAFSNKFILARYALVDDYANVTKYYKKCKEEGDMNCYALCSFPLFIEYRNSEEFSNLLKEDETLSDFYTCFCDGMEKDGYYVDEIFNNLLTDQENETSENIKLR